jgi:RHS repeat-associated protein
MTCSATCSADANENLTETFTYDPLNRVTQAQVTQSTVPVPMKTFLYDAIGNLLSKSDVGNYTYGLAGSLLPHAVTSISGGSISTTFTYDPNGNQTAGLGRSISYTSFNKPSFITQGSSTLSFKYDADHQRFQQSAPEGETNYFDAFGVHTELFSSAISQWNDFLMVGGALIGVRVLHSDSSVTTRYFHTDNLGSIAVITDENGAVVERDSYDAWGKRRNPLTWQDDPSGSIESQTTRGFTGQEELADVGLVHLNGRVYDPLVGRMTSADPFVPDPLNGQAWNRYSYVFNNPLAFTDPDGYCFLGMCTWGKAISTFFGRTFGVLFRKVPILGQIFEIGAVGLCAILSGGNPACAAVAFASTSFVAGVTSGNLGYALKAGLIAGVTAFANFGVGELAQGIPGVGGSILNVAGHALVGCGSAVASGGKCGPAALAGGISAAATPLINAQFPNPLGNPGDLFAGTVISATVGGLASVAGGGKFGNGAVTGAFAYLFSPHAGDLWGDDEYGATKGPPYPTYPNSGLPPENIPGGPYTWYPDENNSRGGNYRNPESGYQASWDDVDAHWDVDDGLGNRQRYNRFGAPITEDEAHGWYRGPPRTPLIRIPGPILIVPMPVICNVIPQVCGGGKT